MRRRGLNNVVVHKVQRGDHLRLRQRRLNLPLSHPGSKVAMAASIARVQVCQEVGLLRDSHHLSRNKYLAHLVVGLLRYVTSQDE
jgi:hypothetical protein